LKLITTQTEEFEFDIIVYATGFDAITGAFDHINFIGKGRTSLYDKWKDGPETYLGLQNVGFPNMFTLAGPQSASVGSNFPPAIQAVVDWTCALISHMEKEKIETCEPTLDSEKAWLEEVKSSYQLTLLGSATSWFTGHNSNVDGHDKLRYLVYFNPAPKFREKLGNIASEGYTGFELK
jgi:cation diffusion facilitator CzcD-associated flavoprotein CzcO